MFIKEKCDADWGAMTPAKEGRHCSLCSKYVVDFTSNSRSEIFKYLENHSNICGRIKSSENCEYELKLNLEQIWNSSLKKVEKFALLLFFVFGLTLFSCSDSTIKQEEIILKASSNISFKSKLPITLLSSAPKEKGEFDKKLKYTWQWDPMLSSKNSNEVIFGDFYEVEVISISGSMIADDPLQFNLVDWIKDHPWDKEKWDEFNNRQIRLETRELDSFLLEDEFLKLYSKS